MTRRWLIGALFTVVASGCLTVGDENGPILQVELFWDERPDSSRFVEGTCHGADVYDMDWSLLDEEGHEVAGADEPCADRIRIDGMLPGEYELVIKGYDRDETELWSVTCGGLLIGRFNAFWNCNVPAE